jgi:hypothetical protein
MQASSERLKAEVSLAAATFSRSERVTVTSGRRGAWVIVMDFPLPRGYSRTVSDLAIRLPDDYPNVPPDGFFLDGGLELMGGGIPHYFEAQGPFVMGWTVPPLPNRRDEKWAWACLHIRQWRPAANAVRGDCLVTVCRLAGDALVRWAKKGLT